LNDLSCHHCQDKRENQNPNNKTLTHSKQQSERGWSKVAALFRRSGSLSLHTVMAAVSSNQDSGTLQQGHGTLKVTVPTITGHCTFNIRWQHPLHTAQQQEVRGNGPQQGNPQDLDCNKKAPPKTRLQQELD